MFYWWLAIIGGKLEAEVGVCTNFRAAYEGIVLPGLKFHQFFTHHYVYEDSGDIF